jgi:transcriptional regulator
LLNRNADTLDSAFFDMSFSPVALVSIDEQKNLLSVESSREAPLTIIRETGKGKDIRDIATIVVETLEQAGVKVVASEM